MNKMLTAKDYASDQEIRWCPGCGDYAILKAVQKSCADLQLKPHQTVFVSGIGCSSRFPYYMNSYGFHTIHGRAPAVASGIKLASPELDVWIVTGDGDGLSIGGNHLLHILRRNINTQILLFNNEIYGLTKGQYSPTSRPGTVSPSSPNGSASGVIEVAPFAFGAGGNFIARAIDTKQKELIDIIKQAHAFQGTAFVEIFQNCIVYNDNVFGEFTDREYALERQLWLKHGEKMIFGKEKDKGVRFEKDSMSLEIVPADCDDILVHDQGNKVMGWLLAEMKPPAFPVALGVLYANPNSVPFTLPSRPLDRAVDPTEELNMLLRQGINWVIDPDKN